MSNRVALIFGGQGALGRSIVSSFNAAKWRTVSVDVAANAEATHNVLISGVPSAAGATADAEQILNECKKQQQEQQHFDAVICVAGGWRGGNVKDNDVFAAVEHMMAFNLYPALTASHVAAQCIAPNGLLVLTGAVAALKPTAGMLAYGLTKNATHYLLKCVCETPSFEKGAGIVGIAPLTLDTPSNRAAMPDADHSTWTSCDVIAGKLIEWSTSVESRPKRGSLVQVLTANNKTEFSDVPDF